MKKFTQFISEGAINAPKDNHVNIFESKIDENQKVNESILLGCLLLWGFASAVTKVDKAVQGFAKKTQEDDDKDNNKDGGFFSSLFGSIAGIGAGITLGSYALKDKIANKKAEKKSLMQDKLNRMFICAQAQMEKETDKNSDEYKEAKEYMNAYAQAKFDDDGKPIDDPSKISDRLKKIVGPEKYAKFEAKSKEAQKNEELNKLMIGLGKQADSLTKEQVKEAETKQQETILNNRVTKVAAEIGNIESEYDKKIKEAQEKGDDALVKSLTAEKEAKIKECHDKMEQAKAAQARFQKQQEADAEKEVLKQQQSDLAAAQKELAAIQDQKAKAIAKANGDEKNIKDINSEYDQQIKEAEDSVKEKQKVVDETSKKIAKLEAEAGGKSVDDTTSTTTTEPKKTKEQKEAEKKLQDLKTEKEQKLIEAGDDEEKKKQIEDEYKEKIKNAEKSVEDANKNALIKAGEGKTEPKSEPKTDSDDEALKKDKLEFKDEDGNTYTKNGDKYIMKDKDGEEVEVKKEEFEQQYKDNRIDGDEEDEKNEGEDEDDKEVADDDDQTDVEEINGKKVHRNPAKIWHKKKKKSGKGSTKNYYDKDGNSISQEEFKERMHKFKERKAKAKESLNNMSKFQKFIFEKNRKSESNTLSNYLKNQMIR